MNRAHYSGLCIGGPKDREVVASQDSKLHAELKSTYIALLEPGEVPSGKVAVEHVSYSFAAFWRIDRSGNEERRGFWIPSDVKADPLLFAVDRLAADYMAGADKVAAERERCARIVERGLGLTNTQIARMIREGGA